MSRYSIYRIDHHDPELIGKRRRKLGMLFASGALIYVPVILGIKELFRLDSGTANLIAMVIMYSAIFIGYISIKKANKKFQIIGNIEFTRNSIIKTIGDSTSVSGYDSVKCIELKKHIPAISIAESKSGYFSYVLTLLYNDTSRENLIVSDRPVEKNVDLSIVETVKTIHKITAVEISVR